MAAGQSSPQPSPILFFETMRVYQHTAALKTALELELFSAIAEGNTSAEAAARRCKASERGTRILCDFLVVIGFLTKENGCYGLTPDSAAFLDRRSPAYVGGAVEFLGCSAHAESFANLTDAVRRGGRPVGDEGSIVAENPDWVRFARGMAGLQKIPAERMAQAIAADTRQTAGGPVRRVLDIAAGHGVYGITLAQHCPDAEITAVDWPSVLEVAKENAQAAGIAGRYRTIPGSAFDVEYGSGYDVVLLTGFLHHFDPPTCEQLLRKVYSALNPGGRAVTVEFVPNEDRVSPPVPATFSLMMLVSTPAGDAYTFSQLEKMFRNAGFRSSEQHSLAPSFLSALISRK